MGGKPTRVTYTALNLVAVCLHQFIKCILGLGLYDDHDALLAFDLPMKNVFDAKFGADIGMIQKPMLPLLVRFVQFGGHDKGFHVFSVNLKRRH
jgi:hypothetical protein